MSSLETIDYEPFFENARRIRSQAFYFFELNNRSRRLSGYALFVIYVYFYVKYLRFIATNRTDITVISITLDDDEEEPEYVRSYTLKEVSQRWNLLSIIVVKAWKFRANKLNQRPPVGKIVSARRTIAMDISLDHIICLDVENSWNIIRMMIQKYMVSKRRCLFCNKLFRIGQECVRRGKHVFIEAPITISTIFCLFGEKCGKFQELIVSKTTRVTIMHVWSASMMKKIFHLANEHAAKVNYGLFKYELCGKVHYTRGKRNYIGYIVDEDASTWFMRQTDNNIVRIPKQVYDETKLCMRRHEIVCYDVTGKFVNVDSPHTRSSFNTSDDDCIEQIELDW